LTDEQVIELQKELIEVYADSSFQAKLSDLKVKFEEGSPQYKTEKTKLVIGRQSPVIAKYGLPPGVRGAVVVEKVIRDVLEAAKAASSPEGNIIEHNSKRIQTLLAIDSQPQEKPRQQIEKESPVPDLSLEQVIQLQMRIVEHASGARVQGQLLAAEWMQKRGSKEFEVAQAEIHYKIFSDVYPQFGLPVNERGVAKMMTEFHRHGDNPTVQQGMHMVYAVLRLKASPSVDSDSEKEEDDSERKKKLDPKVCLHRYCHHPKVNHNVLSLCTTSTMDASLDPAFQ